MDPKMSFVLHREFAKKKADNALGFVKRECYKTLNMDSAKLLYGALVRPHLEFANVIWSPYASSYKCQIESTQKQAVTFMHRDNINREENEYVLAPYLERCEELGLISLNRCRVNSAVLWIQKIITGRINSPDLRSQLVLHTEDQITNQDFIQLNLSRTFYGSNSPFNNACRAYNHAVLYIDPTLPYNCFKNEVLRLPDSAFGDLSEI